MESVQTWRWILVYMTAAAAVIAGFLGFYVPAAILLLGVTAHATHWYMHRDAAAAGPTEH
ncbi:MAG TPA: hypothetical protein VMM13_13410 [Euzebya sp.]|nr:hypothetical protein [Euzebya sp.]